MNDQQIEDMSTAAADGYRSGVLAGKDGGTPTTHFHDIRKWAEDRNLIEGSTPSKQLNKLMEEIGELAHGINKGRTEEVVDGIGDAVVVLTILAAQSGLTVEECIESAWLEIKDRKGRMVDGVFVKDGD